jgi:hypothetical protein
MVILGAVLALAQAGAPVPANSCLSVAVSSAEAPRRRGGTFSATQILDLQFGAVLKSRLQGEHLLSLKVYTPNGHLYQQLDVPFRGGARRAEPAAAGGEAAGPRMRRVDGYPQPLVEQELAPVRTASGRRYQVSARLPVAGTSIMTSSLYGKWKVVPHLDGNLKPCGPATRFSITQ